LDVFKKKEWMWRNCLLAVLLASLYGCGSSDGNDNRAPDITLAATVSVGSGETVTLTASALDADGTVASYSWSQVSGTTVEFSKTTTASTTFVAPIATKVQSLVVRLTVTDNKGKSSHADVTVIVAAGVAAPSGFWMRAVGGNAIANWDTVTGASSYNVYMATESFASLSSLDDYATLENAYLYPNITSAPATPYQISGLASNTRYYFVVTANCSSLVCGTATESVASDEITRLVGQTFTYQQALQDTTLQSCINADGEWADCPVTNMMRQDAEEGRTATALAGNLIKSGSGIGAQDLTALNAKGLVVTDSTVAECVLDNLTRLTWELKTNTSIYRMDGNRFSWYSADNTTNGGDAGLYYGPECSGTACNTASYLAELNDTALCGETEWRLPTVSELRSISDLGGLCDGEDASCWFDTHAWYWTANSWAGDASQAWIVSLDGRPDVPYSKELPRQVMMVSGGSK
jgi:hypothetical protein